MTLKGSNNSLLDFFGAFLVISILFFPEIHLGSGLPAFQIVDFVFPLTLILLYMNRSSLKWNNYYFVFVLFCLYIPISSAINGRLTVLNDYFEIYKIFKFFILILFFSLIDYREFINTWAKPIFVALVGINMFHFYNIFGTNTFLVNYYDQGIQLEYFGLNSLKEPAVKRMIGLAGNPNVNSVIFSFFAVCFLPLKFEKKQFLWFLAAVLMIFLCQSRTSLISFGFILIAIAIFKLSNWNWKNWLTVLLSVAGMFLIAWAMATDLFKYNAYSANLLDGSAFMTNSARGRWESWNFLGKMIIEKPIFGHGPNKEFFYKNNLYSENEYILIAWRYGAVGLSLYLFMLLYPFKVFLQEKTKSTIFNFGILIIILILVTALTNNPFTERTINLLLACSLGLMIPQMTSSRKLFK